MLYAFVEPAPIRSASIFKDKKTPPNSATRSANPALLELDLSQVWFHFDVR
jgi:hypothetical protein